MGIEMIDEFNLDHIDALRRVMAPVQWFGGKGGALANASRTECAWLNPAAKRAMPQISLFDSDSTVIIDSVPDGEIRADGVRVVGMVDQPPR